MDFCATTPDNLALPNNLSHTAKTLPVLIKWVHKNAPRKQAANLWLMNHSNSIFGAATNANHRRTGVATDSGASAPKLAKQMAIAADFERVYKIGPVFQAENSSTSCHMS
ncbi:hypothetical protein PtB15_3B667 [Puccinia triticina]|nr:hypothetical protein PtB15_3B667 [Puccinia triticina]